MRSKNSGKNSRNSPQSASCAYTRPQNMKLPSPIPLRVDWASEFSIQKSLYSDPRSLAERGGRGFTPRTAFSKQARRAQGGKELREFTTETGGRKVFNNVN
jgi:hypothetical protein